jgi:coenzyme F420-reducing hydrogenase delta subunit/Pyruvate/2-oxoacid:ferredoxin oxidoreductase delta subunit
VLGLELDQAGFAQCDNVRRMSNFTNRRGMFTAGSARAVMSDKEIQRDADQAALEISNFLLIGDQQELPRVQIVPGRCARCLTCHRLCPHHAIDIGPRISVVSQACQSCGICAAGCPARAIEVEGVHVKTDLERLPRPTGIAGGNEDFNPCLVLFCCSRSAGQAHKLATAMGSCLPSKTMVVEIPCGGTVSIRHLLAAFDAGADGVMLCTCHQDNCKSQQGSSHARKRAMAASETLTMAGMETERMLVIGMAANMGAEFIRTVEEFHRKMRTLGPWVSANGN